MIELFWDRFGKDYLTKQKGLKVTGLTILAAILVLVVIFSTFLGSVHIPLKYVLEIFWSQVPILSSGFVPHYTLSAYEIIVFLREPEILGGVVIGASLGIGGAVIQSIFRNPITEPYIIGISGGASLGAVMSIILGITVFGLFSVQISAFLFSLVAVGAIYMISYRQGSANPTYLLLTGIAISFFFSSIVALLLFSNYNLEGEAFFWLLGSLENITWTTFYPVFGIIAISSLMLSALHRELDAMQLGERHARGVGVNVERTKALSVSLVTLSVSAAVSISGLIGFVGLIIPHISRTIFGGSNKYVIPASGLLGAIFLLFADDIARSVVNGVVIPVGIITGMIGVPFFLFMMRRLLNGRMES